MSKTNSRINIVPPYSKGSLFVPTLLSLALLSAFSSSALANSGGFLFEDYYGIGDFSYGNNDATGITNNNVIIDEGFSGVVYGAQTIKNNQVISGNRVTVQGNTVTVGVGGAAFVNLDTGEDISAELNDNHVSISGGATVDDQVYGSYFFIGGELGGGAEVEAASVDLIVATNNSSVTVSSSTVDGNVNGSYSYLAVHNGNISSEASNNTLIISAGSTVNSEYGYVAGGETYVEVSEGNAGAYANNNSVTVDDSTSGDVYGGKANAQIGSDYEQATEGTINVNANGNAVLLSDGATASAVFGGYANARVGYVEALDGLSNTNNSGNVSSNYNSVTIDSLSKIEAYVYGGFANISGDGSFFAEANNNTVEITDGSTVSRVYGADPEATVYGDGAASVYAENNSIIVSGKSSVTSTMYGADAEAYVYGGGTASAYAINNSVKVSGEGTGIYKTYGGYAEAYVYQDENKDVIRTANAFANNNSVLVSDKAVVDGPITGGYVEEAGVYGDGQANAEANGNSVVISGGAFVDGNVRGGAVASNDEHYGALVTGDGSAVANANNNSVTISNSTVTSYVGGGYAYAEVDGIGTSAANANNNTIVISNSTVEGDVIGAEAMANADDDKAGASTAYANINTVTISNSKVSGVVFGGYADAYYGSTNIEQASYNTVIIDSAEVSGDLIAGGAVCVDVSTDSHTATYNTVNIGGAYAIDDVSLYGAYVYVDFDEDPSVSDDLFTGNTLNLDASLKTNTTTVGQVANFETINLRAGEVASGAIILEATGGAILGDGNSKGTTVNLLSVDTGSLDAGNYIMLISNADGTLANEGQKQFVPIGDSVALGYNGEVALDDTENKVVFNIESKGITPKTKVLNESRAAEMAFLNSASDLLQDQDIHKAGKHVFGAVRGIYNKYKTGSSVDISGMGLVTGVANTWAGDSADLTGAVFVEAGWGGFDTKNSIGGAVQRGDGDSYYYGTGLIGKYDVTQGLFSGLYAEAAAHVGIISTDYSNAGLTTLNGVKASYDTDSLYYAAHATAGYRWNVTDKFDLDLSATYLWNYLESQEVKIAADKFDFDSVQSHRMRLAAEVGYTGDKGFRPYAGVAWEREFDGEAGGSVAGYRIEKADLGGNSGLAWAGVTFEPKEGGPVKADAEITTYVGQRKGVSGRVWVRYEF